MNLAARIEYSVYKLGNCRNIYEVIENLKKGIFKIDGTPVKIRGKDGDFRYIVEEDGYWVATIKIEKISFE